jgi:ribonuclease P protein component
MRTEHLDVRISDSLLSHSRVAVVVGKEGHTIVERNRVRRRLREIVRTRFIPQVRPVDCVIRAFESAYDASFAELQQEVEKIAGNFRSSEEA